MKKVIVDTSPIIFSAKATLINLLKRMYKYLYVTPVILKEIKKPIELGYDAPEVELIEKTGILKISDITAKDMMEAKKLAIKHNIGSGEADATMLFKSGGYNAVIVADRKAEKKLREVGVNAVDIVNIGREASEKKLINVRTFAQKLYDAHYRTEAVKELLGRHF